MIRTSAILFLLFFFPVLLLAQKTIRGTVTDAKSGETLPSTNILIEGTYRGTITNANGAYTLAIPDSLLPATVLVRYIGYQSQSRKVSTGSSWRQDFALEPSVTELDEIVVTDEDPALGIMREVIRRKQEWRKKLNTYRAEAYTRQNLSNDTSIVSITESVSEVFWDKEQGHREVLKSRRQTANIEDSENFAGVSYLPNFYDDDIEIAGFEMVGVTHPDALNFYNFKLIDQTSLDDRTVYEIQVTPGRNLQPLFEGTIFVLDEAYSLLEVNLTPNDVVNFPPPVKSFNLDYEQQFNNYGQDFWLPVDVRIGGDIKISMIGLDFPLIKFYQVSRVTNYRVNAPLPDSLYKKDDVFTVDSVSVASDSLITKQMDTVPLSLEEEEAYATLDSTATLEEAFKPSGFLANLMDDEDEDNSGPGFLSKIPGELGPGIRYNRVDQLFAGLTYRVEPWDWLQLRGRGGYNTGYEDWDYGGGLSVRWLDSDSFQSRVGWSYDATTAIRNTSPIYKHWYVILPNLLGDKGYFDYYRMEGFRIFSNLEMPLDLSVEVGFNSEDHTSLVTTTAYDLIGKTNNFQLNPQVDEGRLQSIDFEAGYNLDEEYNFGITERNVIRFKVEHSSDELGSDFNFTSYQTHIAWTFPTFYQRRFLPNTLDVNLRAGTFSGDLPFQKLGTVDAAIGESAPMGTLRTRRGRPYEGEQYVSLLMEHNFRTVPFEALGLRPLVERNIGLIAFGGMAKTWGPDWTNQQIMQRGGYFPTGTPGIHWEVGASLNGIFGLFRIDFAARLDEPAFLVNFGAARLF